MTKYCKKSHHVGVYTTTLGAPHPAVTGRNGKGVLGTHHNSKVFTETSTVVPEG